jgi:hypothetical protein
VAREGGEREWGWGGARFLPRSRRGDPGAGREDVFLFLVYIEVFRKAANNWPSFIGKETMQYKYGSVNSLRLLLFIIPTRQ